MGKYTITKSPKGKFHFNLASGNGEVVLSSQMYAAKKSAVAGIASVAKNAPVAVIQDETAEGFKVEANPKFVIYLDKAKEFRFRLIAPNGKPIGASEGYSTMKACKAGIASVKKNAPSKTEDTTAAPAPKKACKKSCKK